LGGKLPPKKPGFAQNLSTQKKPGFAQNLSTQKKPGFAQNLSTQKPDTPKKPSSASFRLNQREPKTVILSPHHGDRITVLSKI
jgi:hypothetical protein